MIVATRPKGSGPPRRTLGQPCKAGRYLRPKHISSPSQDGLVASPRPDGSTRLSKRSVSMIRPCVSRKMRYVTSIHATHEEINQARIVVSCYLAHGYRGVRRLYLRVQRSATKWDGSGQMPLGPFNSQRSAEVFTEPRCGSRPTCAISYSVYDDIIRVSSTG
jgi:hypothetical protein